MEGIGDIVGVIDLDVVVYVMVFLLVSYVFSRLLMIGSVVVLMVSSWLWYLCSLKCWLSWVLVWVWNLWKWRLLIW